MGHGGVAATHLQAELAELRLYPGEGGLARVLLPLLPQGHVVLLGRPGDRSSGAQPKLLEADRLSEEVTLSNTGHHYCTTHLSSE